MFIRWKTEEGPSSRAILVESMRTLSGPRLRHVAYLGSFKEDNLAQDNARAWFRITYKVAIEIEGGERPACVAEVIGQPYC